MIKTVFLLIVCFCCSSLFSFERFTNYGSTIRVNQFDSDKNNLYVASSGGIFVLNRSTLLGSLLPNNNFSPDPNITAAFLSNNGVWTGSYNGFLTKRSSDLNVLVSNAAYSSAQWHILGINQYGKYLLIASNRGISFFNTEKGLAEKNATKFGSLSTSQVNVIKVFRDTLYAGTDQGIAKLYLGSNLDKNFYDPSIWTIDTNVTKPVKSILFRNGTYQTFSKSATSYNGGIIHAEGTELFHDSALIADLRDTVSTIYVDDQNVCWIGTVDHYFYRWDGKDITHFQIPGLSISSINKIYVSSSGTLWLLPQSADDSWWVGIEKFTGTSWKLYKAEELPGGKLSDGPYNQAIIETPDKNVWFGLSGGNVRRYSPEQNSWQLYCVRPRDYSKFYEGGCDNWGKTDAFAIDSNGYLWLSSWDEYKGAPSLICYDYRKTPDNSQVQPEDAHFRKFFPSNTTEGALTFRSIVVDNENRIIAGSEGKDGGKVIILTYDENPLRDGVRVEKMFNGVGTVHDAALASDGTVFVVTSTGLHDLDPAEEKLNTNDLFGINLTSIESENGRVFWIGTSGDGLIRYDMTTDEKSTISIAQGLLSNQIRDLAFDKENGALWIATDIGLSKMDLGYKVEKDISKKDIEVFPSPFSKTKSSTKTIFFRNIPSESKVSVYSMDGRLVAKPEMIRQGNGAIYEWKPGTKILPGPYFVAIGNGSVTTTKKLLIVP